MAQNVLHKMSELILEYSLIQLISELTHVLNSGDNTGLKQKPHLTEWRSRPVHT